MIEYVHALGTKGWNRYIKSRLKSQVRVNLLRTLMLSANCVHIILACLFINAGSLVAQAGLEEIDPEVLSKWYIGDRF